MLLHIIVDIFTVYTVIGICFAIPLSYKLGLDIWNMSLEDSGNGKEGKHDIALVRILGFAIICYAYSFIVISWLGLVIIGLITIPGHNRSHK